ncbi:MAG: hypothetical protein ABR549_17240 [Mycobacteriales bacterium]
MRDETVGLVGHTEAVVDRDGRRRDSPVRRRLAVRGDGASGLAGAGTGLCCLTGRRQRGEQPGDERERDEVLDEMAKVLEL